MANLLGHKAWNRGRGCKRVNCCNRPRWSQHAQRQREHRQWQDDWFEETAPEYPEWIDKFYTYQVARCDQQPCKEVLGWRALWAKASGPENS